MNRVIITGRLTADPEAFTTNNGAVGVHFTLAVRRAGRQSDGQPMVDFVRMTAWKEVGAALSKYTGKGQKVLAEGVIRQDRWTDREGRKRSNLQVVCLRVEFLEPMRKKNQTNPTRNVYSKETRGGFPNQQPAVQSPNQQQANWNTMGEPVNQEKELW